MSNKPAWQMPRLIAINPFGGSNANPYEVATPGYGNPSTIVGFTAGGDSTTTGFPPITDFDETPAFSSSGGPFYVSTVAPLS